MASYQGYGGSQPQGYNVGQQHPYPPEQNDAFDMNKLSTRSAAGSTNTGSTRVANRTPSPTPSEEIELRSTGVFNWKTMSNWRYWIRKEWIVYYIVFTVLIVLSALMTIYHKQIVNWLKPVATWMHDLNFGWLIPIAVLFVISFPPLFGHEIVAVLCGVVWGLWIGFAIVSAGTFIGEVGNFYAFKYCCRARGEKLEKTKISYACLARVVREGGFRIALIARLSAIPGHFTTAVFSTCGMNIFVFSLAAVLSLPKQFITVYLGVMLETTGTGTTNTKSRIISDSVIAVTTIITFAAMWYIYHEMAKVKVSVIYDRRKARQTKLDQSGFASYDNSSAMMSTNSIGFNPRDSEADLPLTGESLHQRWDRNGNAVGYSGDPRLYAPQPQHGASALQDQGLRDGGYHNEGVGSVYPKGDRANGGRSPVRSDSSDSVGFAMPPGAEETHDRYGLPRSTSPSAVDPFANKGSFAAYSSPIGATSLPPSSAKTPTQAQYANQQTLHTSDITSPQLPSTFHPDQADSYNPYEHGHGIEPSDASYYTASSHSKGPTDEPFVPKLSPPPNSRRGNEQGLR